MMWGLEDVTVEFGNYTALASVDIPVEAGSITAIVGGDGAGKTTVARTLVGLISPKSGIVRRPKVFGFQPAASGTWRDLTVMENLEFVATAFGIDPATSTQRIDQLVDSTNLGHATHRLSSQLSGGMRQKLGVAMAILPEPQLLVLDEPTTGVDPVSRLEIWAFVASAAAEGCGVLMTTTYVDEAARANTVVALDQGATLASGTPREVLSSMPGSMYVGNHRTGTHSWRRGRQWRIWTPDDSAPQGATPVGADLDDVITVAAMTRQRSK